MILTTLASGMMYYLTSQTMEVSNQPMGSIHYREVSSVAGNNYHYHHSPAVVKPLAQQVFRGIVKQAYDYSCGSAALTTLLNGYVGANLTERQTMNGLLNFGERERIIKRRSFSLLDMKRFVSALGLKSGGYKGDLEDLKKLDKPVIILIHYAGFDHFVVYKGAKNGRVFVADPALGNISFMEDRFVAAWDNTLFMISPSKEMKTRDLLAIEDNDMRIVEDATVNLHAFADVATTVERQKRVLDYAATTHNVIDIDPKSNTYQKPIAVPMRLYYKRK